MLPTENQLPLLGLDFLQWYGAGNVWHPGLDLGTPGNSDLGNEVKAVRSGVVEYVHTKSPFTYSRGFGKFVIIKHPGKKYTRYAHLLDITVDVGDKVQAGQVIGHLGATGGNYSPHLHLEAHGEKLAKVQREHKYPWRFYPAGENKSWVKEHYDNPWDFMEEVPVSEWAEDAMEFLIDKGITNGDRPHDWAVREEVWVMLYRLERSLKRYINQVLLDLRDWK